MNTDKQPQMDEKCIAGCKEYYGGEKKHHKDCPFYPDSLSEYYDKRSCYTPEELEALLQKERREAAEKALYKGHKIGLSGYLENSCVIEYEIKIYLDQHYPLPQPPKKIL